MMLHADYDQTVYNDVFYASRPGLQTFYQPPETNLASGDEWGQKAFGSKRWASALVCSVHIISLS